MIRIVELECPNCGAGLTQINRNSCKCKYCNASFLIDRSNPNAVTVVPKPNRDNRPVIILLTIMICIAIMGFIVYSYYETKNQYDNNTQVETNDGIKSEFFKTFLEEVFDEPVDQLTEDDFQKFKYLKLDDGFEYNTVEYAFDDGMVKTVRIPTEIDRRFRTEDYHFFRELEEFDVEEEVLYREDLKGLFELKSIHCGNTLSSLAEAIQWPDKIVELDLYCGSSDLTGIELFPELISFKIKDRELTNVSAIANASKLENVSIESDGITNCNAIESLSNLKTFYLYAENIKDVSFLGNIKTLESIEIIRTQVKDISFLKNLTNLKRLNIGYNSEIKDYSAIGEVTGLEELSYYFNSNSIDADLSRLTNLKKLNLQGGDALASINPMTELEELSVARYSTLDCNSFSGLSNLKSLKINCSSYGEITNLDSILALTNLQKLDISDAKIMSDITMFFNLPNLYELNFSNSTVGLEPSIVPENTNIKVLNLSETRFVYNIHVVSDGFISMVDYDTLTFSEYLPAICNCKGLEELYIRGDSVDSLDFVGFIPELRILDISNNYVTDITPLSDHAKMEILYCKDTPITQGLNLSEKFTIDTKTEFAE